MVKKRNGLFWKMGKWAKTGMIFGGGVGFVRAISSAKTVIDGSGDIHLIILMGLIALVAITTVLLWMLGGVIAGHGIDLVAKKR